MFRRKAPTPYAWMQDFDPSHATARRVLRGRSVLYKMRRGAVLMWRFDEDDDGDSTLYVHLTDAESQRVFDTDKTDGMIEAVRQTLRDPWSVLAVRDADGTHVRRLQIQSWASEFEFAEDLRIAAAAVAEFQANVRFSLEAEIARLRIDLNKAVIERDDRLREREALQQRLTNATTEERTESSFVKAVESLPYLAGAIAR